jgi:hypothetical protein
MTKPAIIIPNTNSTITLVEYWQSEDDEAEENLYFTPIVAWRINYEDEPQEDFGVTSDLEGGMDYAIPIIPAETIAGTYGIYNTETREWWVPQRRSGIGKEDLLECLKFHR